jgi:hypothetical protein
LAKLHVKASSWEKDIGLCRMTGHIRTGYGGGVPYGTMEYFTTDGIGTRHCRVVANCDRCGRRFTVVNFHMPKEWQKIEGKE